MPSPILGPAQHHAAERVLHSTRGTLSLAASGWPLRIAIGLATFAVILLTRWLIAPRYLYYFDSINFALALEEFDPSRHQPQPPGYPLFVALGRILHWFVPEVELVFLLAGAIGATLAVLLLWLLGEHMFGRKEGILAALLLLFHPAFWLAGVTNQVRIFLAAGALAVALPAWFAWREDAQGQYFTAAAALLGVMSGFRPDLVLFLLPLVVMSGLHSRRPARSFAAAGMQLLLYMIPWVAALAIKAGGLGRLYALLTTYLAAESRKDSVLLGAALAPAQAMIFQAFVWNMLGLLSCVWAVPWAARRFRNSSFRQGLPFLAAWFLPPFLFHCFVHVGDPDQTLVTVPVICLLGGWLLARFLDAASTARSRRIRWIVAIVLVVDVNALLFFRPLPSPATAASYRVVEWVDNQAAGAFTAIRELKASGPVFLVACQTPLAWRKVAYYFPDDPMLVLPECLTGHSDPSTAWIVQHNKTRPPETDGDGTILLPADRRIIWLLLPEAQAKAALEAAISLSLHEPLLYSSSQADRKIEFSGYCFEIRSK
jgi:hypothetical protein